MIGMEDPEQLEIGLVAARHLTSFNLSGMSWGASKSRLHKRSLADFFVGTYCNQAVTRLLQDPHSQLRHLHLSKCKLHDDHFIPILDLLSASRLQTLDVSCNYITHRGVMEFARCLPNIKFLTSISLECNMWVMYPSDNPKNLVDDLVRGIMQNTSLEHFGKRKFKLIPQDSLIEYYCNWNRERRKILSASTTLPLGLWPLILEREQTSIKYALNMSSRTLGRRQTDIEYEAGKIFLYLQNNLIPILFGRR